MIEAFPFLYHLCAGALVLIGVLILCCLVYGVRGRRFTDRVVAVNVVGTLTISAICILSFALQESYILDIALIYALASVYLRHLVTLTEALTVWGLSICVSLVFTGIVYIFYFLLGKKIGTIIYVAAAAILGGMYGSSTVFIGIESYTSMDMAARLWFLLPASLAVFVLSCLLSIQIYKKKYS